MRGQEKLDILIKEVISPLFKQNRFQKTGKNYYRLNDDFGFVFNVQSSQFNTKDSVRFTFNIGIFIPSAYRLNRGEDPPIKPKDIDCLNPRRIGHLKGQSDSWYEINDDTDLSNLKNEIEEDLLRYVFPYYNQFHTIDDIIEISMESLKSDKKIFNEVQLSAILISLGNRVMGERLFLEYYNRRIMNESSLEFLKYHAERLQINF